MSGPQGAGEGAVPLVERAALPVVDAPLAYAVPNVSEGRDIVTIDALADACRVPGVRVLDVHSDADHNRSVLTLAGEPLAVQEAAVSLAAECVDRIDLRRQRGVHPRIGALDVLPLVVHDDAEMPLACEMAEGLASRIADHLGLPVFLYGAVASGPGRSLPRDFRRDGLEALGHALDDGRLVPDAGPPRLHPSAGAVLVGVRRPLVALNVWLPDAALADARAIADRVREAGGGMPGVRALGLYLPKAGMVQVSMNIEDYVASPVPAVLAAVRREAVRLGVEAGDAELVGLIPRDALGGVSPAALGIAGFRPAMVVESSLQSRIRERSVDGSS
jgi:glutamate formiminotransferase / 5-formyltetrahydrofolate cyclo-ligase